MTKLKEYGLSVVGENDSTDVLFNFTESEARLVERIVWKINSESRSYQQPTMRFIENPEGKSEQYITKSNCQHEHIASHPTDAWCQDCGQSV